MYIFDHIPEQSGAFEDSTRWAPFLTASALSLAVMLLAVGCGQEATAPQRPGPISPQVVSSSNQSAVGAKPIQQFHNHFTEGFSTEICGIPADGRVVVTDNFFLYADGSFKDASSVKFTFTNPANGKSVLLSSAGQISGPAPIVDEQAGTITFLTSYKGLPEKIQTANGRVLLRDAGIITFADTFDSGTGEFISSEITVKGPHPEADSDFTLFCKVFSSALT